MWYSLNLHRYWQLYMTVNYKFETSWNEHYIVTYHSHRGSKVASTGQVEAYEVLPCIHCSWAMVAGRNDQFTTVFVNWLSILGAPAKERRPHIENYNKDFLVLLFLAPSVPHHSPIIHWLRKVSFHPETGPGFSQNDQNTKFVGTHLFLLEFSIFFLVFRFFWQAVKP